MKQDFLPIIALVFLIPLFISPITVESFSVNHDNDVMNVLVVFESPKSEIALKQDIENDLFGKFNAIGNTFRNQANYTSFQDGNFTIATQDIHEMVWSLGDASGNNKKYELSPEIHFTGNTTMSQGQFEAVYDTQISQMRLDLIEFLENNNAIAVRTHLSFSFGEIEIDEQF